MTDPRSHMAELLGKALADVEAGRFTGLAICGINGRREHLMAWVLDDVIPTERGRLAACAQVMAEGILLGRGEISTDAPAAAEAS